ncbi:Beta-2 adrenergic receptor [Halotydeus destructor]|nr:Beta-2 adrenergic receptor [Halotydeus destructor]
MDAFNASSSEYIDEVPEGIIDECSSNFVHIAIASIIFATVFFNLLVVLSFCVFSSLRTPFNYYVASLACADLGVGLLVMPCELTKTFKDGRPDIRLMGCQIDMFCDILFSVSSICHLLAISIKRYRALFHALTYQQTNHALRATTDIAIVWVISFTLAAPVVFLDELTAVIELEVVCDLTNELYAMILLTLGFFLPLVLTLFCYTRIYLHLKHTTSGTSSAYMHRRELQVNKTILLVISVFVVCWLPIKLIDLSSRLATEIQFPRIIVVLAGFVSFCHSALNPVIYAVHYSEFREAFKKLLCLEKCFAVNGDPERPVVFRNLPVTASRPLTHH